MTTRASVHFCRRRAMYELLYFKKIIGDRTRGVFLSVFRLTSTGLSYFTNEAFGGIIFAYQL